MTLRSMLMPWQRCLIPWLFYSGIFSQPVVSSQGDPHCSSTFQVWQPGQDAQRMIRELHLKLDNVTSYTKYQVAEMRAHMAEEVSRVNTWMFSVDKRVFEMHISQMDEELKEMKYDTGTSKIQSDVRHTKRRVDDLEKIVYGIRSKLRNIGAGDVSTKKKQIHDTLQRQEGVSENLGHSLQNRIGDLTAEWVLLKRDVVGLEKEDKRHRKQIQIFMNKTMSLTTAVDYVSSANKDLQEKNLELTIQQSEVKERMDEIASATQDVQTSLNQLKAHDNGKILAELQVTTNKLRNDLYELTSKVNNIGTRRHGPVSREDTRNEVLEESGGRSEFATLHLPGSKEDVTPNPDRTPSTGEVFRDCHDVYKAGFHVSSVYDILLDGSKYRVPVYCYMTNGTGYTLIQRRVDGTVSFNRPWMVYKQGFGNPYGEIWAGNEFIHRLSKQKRYILRIDLWDWEGDQFYAEYNRFWVEGEEDHYRIHVGGYHGNAGDSLLYHTGMAFSTMDVDNDLHDRNCAAEDKGGWWYNGCFYSQLNGLYHTGWYSHSESKYADGIVWFTLKNKEFYSVKKVEMLLKPLEM